jgi:hypothetical protein
MEQKVGLTFYELTVHTKGKPKDRQVLNQLTKKNPDIYEEVKRFFNALPVYKASKLDLKNKDTQKKVFLEGKLEASDRQIKGLVRHGQDGFSSTFFDLSSGAKSFEREPHHVELMPFCIFGDFETGKKSAILAFQTFGIYSVGGKIRDRLEDFLNKIYDPQYRVNVRVIQVGVSAISRYLKDGKVKDITATRYYIPNDQASDNSEDIKYSITLSPRKRGARFLPTLNNIFKQHIQSKQPPNSALFKSIGEFFSIDLSDFNELEFLVDLGGVYRKVDLWDVSKSATKFDITDDIKRKADGHPTFSSVNIAANDILVNTVKKVVSK